MISVLRFFVIFAVCFGMNVSVTAQTKENAARVHEYSSLVLEYMRRGENQKAADAFTKSLEFVPNQRAVHLSRAIVLINLQSWEKQEADCTRVIELDFENSRAFQQRAVARSVMGRTEDAFKDASRAARMSPDDPNIVFTRYLVCSRSGRHELGHYAGETYIGLQSWSDTWAPYIAMLNNISLRRAGLDDEAKMILNEASQWLKSDLWPYPLIDYLRGEKTAEALIEGTENIDARTLAHYYIGANLWLTGDIAGAKSHFEWIRANGNQAFLQYLLAGDHLMEIEKGIAPTVK